MPTCSDWPGVHQGLSEVSSNNTLPWPALSEPSGAMDEEVGTGGSLEGPPVPALPLINVSQ